MTKHLVVYSLQMKAKKGFLFILTVILYHKGKIHCPKKGRIVVKQPCVDQAAITVASANSLREIATKTEYQLFKEIRNE